MPAPNASPTLKRAPILALLLVVLTCVAPRLRRLELPTYPADFNVYYCAASLVRHSHAALLYQGADTAVSENFIPYLLFGNHAALSASLHLAQLLAALAVILIQIASFKQPPSQTPPFAAA